MYVNIHVNVRTPHDKYKSLKHNKLYYYKTNMKRNHCRCLQKLKRQTSFHIALEQTQSEAMTAFFSCGESI